ncbi:hypothetical protein PN441_00485 [Spirulina major CS-329]|uniref:hypothetical protein n=1 Tax=Spirulina TaxID=1154 RepID=UPI0023313500|nr:MULTISPECIES: hypothetical protein [Spirulina]MDB9495137.1 hypothetical protein [Spirulina subsalsa CS-330]MDB9501530.1 hypothetical protein [Spirulina major CS-329]
MTLSTLLDTAIDRIGDTNPQLFRELKGRLTVRSLLTIAGLLIFAQALTLIALIGMEPSYILTTSTYCQMPADFPLSQIVDDRCPKQWIDLSQWWLQANQLAFLWIAVGIMFLLIGGGMYLLINDLAKEKRQGTINFILFSPQSTRTIVWGKILGVPSLLYGAIALNLPFHLWFALQGHLGIKAIVSFYLALALITAVYFHIALLAITLSNTLTGLEAWLVSGVSCALLAFLNYVPVEYDAPTLMRWIKFWCPSTILPFILNRQGTEQHQLLDRIPFHHGPLFDWTWFGLPIGQVETLFLGLMLLHGGFCLYWCDRALIRRVRNPSATVWTKTQAYGIFVGFNLIWLGFCWSEFTQSILFTNPAQLWCWMVYVVALMLIVMGSTCPQRQPLIDWARYRHEFEHRRSFIRDLLIGENSPNLMVVLAMGSLLVLVPVLATQFDPADREDILIAATMTTLWLFTYTLLSYVTLLWPTSLKNPLAVNLLIFFGTCPLTIMLGLGLINALTSQYGYGEELYLIAIVVLDSIAFCIGAISMSRQLRFWGQSDWQAIFTLDAATPQPRLRGRTSTATDVELHTTRGGGVS